MSTTEEKKKRSVCILCGSKRSQNKLISFSFNSWLSPTCESRSYHFACKNNDYNYTGKSCFDTIYRQDFNVFILPYTKKPK